MSVKADAETLRSIPIFAECEPVHLQLLAFSAERRSFRPGDAIIEQGQPGTSAHVILDGQAEFSQDGSDGSQILGVAGPGALIGELAMIGQLPYSLTAVAKSAVSTAQINRALFIRVADEYPEFAAAVFRAVARKLDDSMSGLLGAQDAFDRARPFSRS